MENKFKENLRSLRIEKGMSQKKLAMLVGVSQQCVSEWEKGSIEPTLGFIIRLSDIFGVSIDVLVGRSDY